MARRKSRIIAFQGIYSWDVGSISESQVLEFSWVSDEVKNRADYKLSFSKMTFPHQLMRVVLLEQIYRSFRILGNEPYHK